MKLSPVMKITTAAMLMGLAIIFNKLLVIQIPPFIRIGIAAVPIMMSSVLLGPVYGFFVGAIADVLGYFMFDTSNFPYSPFVTISFVILGVLPYFLLMLTRKLRYQKHPIPYSYVLMGAIWTFLLVFILMNDAVTVGGHTWDIYKGTNGYNVVISFMCTSQTTASEVDVKAILDWIEARGWFAQGRDVLLDEVQFGWEIADSPGGLDFAVTDFAVEVK